jgi:glycosyltransferase involved in cell wall biosynthesis
MKILFLTHLFYPEIGGIEVNSEILANGFFENGHEIRLVTWAEDQGDKTFPFLVIRKPDIWKLIRLHVWADVVFENNPCLRLSWPAFFLSKTSVVALRTWIKRDEGNMGWQDQLKLKWLERAGAVITVSKVLSEAYWKKATVIGNPYRDQLFCKLEGRLPSRDFVFLGRLVNDKGADMAIEAVARIMKLKKNPPLTLTVIGDGPEMENLQKLAVDLGVNNLVSFSGALSGSHLVAALNTHQYMLVPSHWKEPFGNVALEGMACGCIPIVADGGGLPDAVGEAGLVFERSNLDALVEAIMEVLTDPLLRDRLQRNAALQLRNHLPEVVTQRYLAVIENAFKKVII